MDFGSLPKVLKQCSISTILVFVGQLVGSLLGSSCFTGTSIRPNLQNIAFVTRTIFVRKLGAEYTGVNGLYTNILTLLSLAELGIGNVLTYSLYGALHDNDHEKLKQLISYYRKLYRYIAAAVTVVGLAIVPFLGQLVKSTLPHNEVVLYYLLFLCNSVVSYFVMFTRNLIFLYQGVVKSSLIAKNYVFRTPPLTILFFRRIRPRHSTTSNSPEKQQQGGV